MVGTSNQSDPEMATDDMFLSTSDLYSQGVLIRMCLNDHIVGRRPNLTPKRPVAIESLRKHRLNHWKFWQTLFSDKPTHVLQ
jgi:hypothetical protein